MMLNKKAIAVLVMVFIGVFGATQSILADNFPPFKFVTVIPKTIPQTVDLNQDAIVEYTITSNARGSIPLKDASDMPSGTVILGADSGYCGDPIVLNAGATCTMGFQIPAQNVVKQIDGQFKTHISGVDITLTQPPFAIQSLYPPPTKITGVNPSFGSVLGGGNVVITGEDFISEEDFIPGDITVKFGDNLASVSKTPRPTPTSMTVTLPPSGTPTKVSTVDVTVKNKYWTSSISRPADQFTYHPLPKITKVSPSVVPIGGTTGTVVIITGTNLKPDANTIVTFGGTPGTIQSINSNSIVVLSPPVSGTSITSMPVKVKTAIGETDPSIFIYALPPTVSSLNPIRGPLAGNKDIDISGANFITSAVNPDTYTTIGFGGVPLSATGTSTDNKMTIKLPPRTTTGDVTVVANTLGIGTSTSLTFTYDPIPTITKITPDRGPAVGGMPVTITGSGFIQGYTTVTFGDVPMVGFLISGDGRTISGTTPASVPQTSIVKVTTPGGSTPGWGAVSSFTYIDWDQVNGGLCSQNEQVNALCSDSLGNVYAGVCWGVYKLSSGGISWTNKYSIQGLTINNLVSDKNDNIYAGSYDDGIFKGIGGESWSKVFPTTTTINDLNVDNLGNIYAALDIGTSGYVYKSSGGGFSNILSKTGETIQALSSDSSGNIYVASDVGTNWVGRVYIGANNGASWSGPVTIDVSNGASVYGLVSDSDGILYAGTFYGLYKSSDKGLTWVNIVPNVRANVLCADKAGNIYYAGSDRSYRTGVFMSKDKGGSWIYLGLPNQQAYMNLIIDKNNILWAGTYRNGIYKYEM